VNKEVVFGGIVYRGKIRNHQQLLLGPDNKGKFRKVEVKSIKCLKVFVQNVVAGQICSIAVNFGISLPRKGL
jgi:GTPase